jgi:hypothetical protein
VWIANTGDNVVTELSSSGAILSGASGYGGGGLANPNYVAIDTAGNAWVTGNGSLNIVEFSDTGSVLSGAYGYSGYNCCGSNSFNGGVSGIAIDQAGNVWVPNYEHNVGISVFSSNGTFVGWSSGASTYFGGGAYGVAIDRLGGVLVPPGIFDYISVFGTPFSPGDGIGVEPGGGLDSPYGVAVDASDNIWITNQGGDASVTETFGFIHALIRRQRIYRRRFVRPA